jgi:predicted nucleic acid-binding Zn ribbon protein
VTSGQFMERASRLMGQLKFPGDSVSAEQLVCAAWSAAVGARIARHARAERLVRTKLIVGVDDAVWQRQLFGMSRMILSKLTENLGDGLVVDELEFRVAAPRRGPQRAERSTTRPPDEADGIEDTDLRRLYITSRKKELA